MKASIIILTYNQQATVGRAIESVLRQKCDYPFEIVVADDDSIDDTRRIAEDYAMRFPEKVRVLPHRPNRGLVGNYFDAVEMCRGEYIGDCAGDDEWADEFRLARQIEALDADPSISVVFTDVEELKRNPDATFTSITHSEIPRRSRWMKPRIAGREILIGTLNHTTELPFTLSAALYRKAPIIQILQSQPNIVRIEEMGIEDVPLIAALGNAGDASYIPIVGYRYYIDGESISNNLSYEKEYHFYTRDTRGTARLASHYGIPTSELREHFTSKLNHIAAQVRHAHRPDLIPEVIATARDYWHVSLPLRARLHLLLTRLSHS